MNEYWQIIANKAASIAKTRQQLSNSAGFSVLVNRYYYREFYK